MSGRAYPTAVTAEYLMQSVRMPIVKGSLKLGTEEILPVSFPVFFQTMLINELSTHLLKIRFLFGIVSRPVQPFSTLRL